MCKIEYMIQEPVGVAIYLIKQIPEHDRRRNKPFHKQKKNILRLYL